MCDIAERAITIPASQLLNKPERLRRLLYVVITRVISGYVLMQQHRPAHLEYLRVLNDSGLLVGAGPTLNESASVYEGDGLIVLQAESIEIATQLAEDDPFHREGVRAYEIQPWLLSEGEMMDKS